MNFTAIAFVAGYPIVLALHWLCPPQLRWILLLIVSLGFYALGSPEAIWLLVIMIIGTYLAALGIANSERTLVRRLWCGGATVLCLGCLAWFKYAGFLAETAALLSGQGSAAAGAISVLLPAGISFYTFQTLSYVFDVARGTMQAERHLGKYALFVCFFPQLVAGPIERSGDLLPQLCVGERTPDWNGAVIMLRGFAEKLLLANTAAIYVDQVYAAPQEAQGVQTLLATVLFAMQIYFDFAGYSDIAIGAAAMLGVRLSTNFDRPYSASSMREFWRRWHISLTRWFTDYLYIPLGGSRRGLLRQCMNTMIVFLASGLWHGAAWHYVVWGGLHGLFLVVETCLARSGKAPRLPHWLAHGITAMLVLLAWVFFRAGSTAQAFSMLAGLPTGWSIAAVTGAAADIGIRNSVVMVLGLALIRSLPEHLPTRPRELTALFWTIIAVAAAWLTSLASDAANAFIYFQF